MRSFIPNWSNNTIFKRIFRPEEFSISSTIKRLDIFEEDRQRIRKAAWLAEEQPREQLMSPAGVFDFYQDWSDEINIDLQESLKIISFVYENYENFMQKIQ